MDRGDDGIIDTKEFIKSAKKDKDLCNWIKNFIKENNLNQCGFVDKYEFMALVEGVELRKPDEVSELS